MSLLFQRADFPEYGFDPIERNPGIDAGSERALIENTVNGQWSGILDPAGEVSFARNGYNEVRAGLDHNSARNGSSGRNRHSHTVFFRKPQEVFYGALAAAFAIFHLVSDLHLAVFILKTMRHEEQNGTGRLSVAAPRENKFVIHCHERMLDMFASKTRQFADADQDRQKELDRKTPELQGERDIVAQREDGDKKPEASKQRGAGQYGNNCHYQGQVYRNPAKTVIRNRVKQDQDGGGNESEKNDKRDYNPFFRTGGRLVDIDEDFLLWWFGLFVHVCYSRKEPTGIGLPQANSHARMRRWPSI
jgi:hypothetical protein